MGYAWDRWPAAHGGTGLGGWPMLRPLRVMTVTKKLVFKISTSGPGGAKDKNYSAKQRAYKTCRFLSRNRHLVVG